jgi:hypothetical protein
MAKRLQQHVEFFLDPVACLSAFDNRRHHRVRMFA